MKLLIALTLFTNTLLASEFVTITKENVDLSSIVKVVTYFYGSSPSSDDIQDFGFGVKIKDQEPIISIERNYKHYRYKTDVDNSFFGYVTFEKKDTYIIKGFPNSTLSDLTKVARSPKKVNCTIKKHPHSASIIGIKTVAYSIDAIALDGVISDYTLNSLDLTACRALD